MKKKKKTTHKNLQSIPKASPTTKEHVRIWTKKNPESIESLKSPLDVALSPRTTSAVDISASTPCTIVEARQSIIIILRTWLLRSSQWHWAPEAPIRRFPRVTLIQSSFNTLAAQYWINQSQDQSFITINYFYFIF